MDAVPVAQEIPLSDSEDTENGESWSSSGGPDPNRPALSSRAREQAKLSIEEFWDLFNKNKYQLYQQKGTGNRQAPASTVTKHIRANDASGSSQPSDTPIFLQSAGNSRSSPKDDDGEDCPPKRRKTTETPNGKIENPPLFLLIPKARPSAI